MSNTQTDVTSNFASNYISPFAMGTSKKTTTDTATNTAKSAIFAEVMDELDESFNVATPKADTQVASASQGASKDYTLLDVVDMINPLQHIPVVSNIYRAVTGDEIRQEIRMAGNVVFGALTGPVGIVTGVGSAVVDHVSGKPVGDHVLAAVAPNLEQTIREDYSVAHHLYNPFSDSPDSAKIAAQPVTVDVAEASQNMGKGQESQAVYAQTAQMLSQKLGVSDPVEKAIGNSNALDEPHISANFSPLTPTTNVAQLSAEQAKEMQNMARSVTSSHSNVVQLTPGAAEQLNLLAGATTNPAAALFNGDTSSQLQAITAKNRQLGLALNSSATISQQMSDAQQDQISFEIGNKVAALYKNNNNIIPQAQNSNLQSMNTAVSSLQQTTPVQQNLRSPNINNLIDDAYISDQDRLKADPRGHNSSPSKSLQNVQNNPVQPNQLGQSYHGSGVNNPTHLSIASAMQQALDKYQSLRK